MKLHFTSPEEYTSQELAAALSSTHEITSAPDAIDKFYDGLIVGVDTSEDQDDVVLAKELRIAIYSIPEIIYYLCEDKQRIVITGTHGKSTLAACVIHVLNSVNKEVDFFFGSKSSGYTTSVRISEAPLIIIEGSANRCSVFDDRPQFLRLNHHVALITQLEHQYEDLYPSFDEYVRQFDRLADATPKGGSLIYCEEDNLVTVIGGKERDDVRSIPYTSHPGEIKNGVATVESQNGKVNLNVSSDYDLQNIGGAWTLLKRLSVTEEQFYKAMESFEIN